MVGIVLITITFLVSSHGQIVYQTSFASSEGYQSDQALGGQLGWSTRGLAPQAVGITETGQAFVGGLREAVPGNPSESNRKAHLERLVGFDPTPTNGLVRFKATFTVHHDNAGAADTFFLLFGDKNGLPLFSLFFFTPQRAVAFSNGLTNLQIAPVSYESDQAFEIGVVMDFNADQWSASLDGQALATDQPLTLSATSSSLGSFNLIWQSDRLGDLDGPRNYILMDDLTFTGGSGEPPRIPIVSLTESPNNLRLIFDSEPGISHQVQSSTNPVDWAGVATINGTNGATQTPVDLLIDARRTLFYRVAQP